MAVTAAELMSNRYDSGVGKGWSRLGMAMMGGDPEERRKREERWQNDYMRGQQMRINDLSIEAKLGAERERRAQEYAQNNYQQDFADAIKNNDTARIIALQQRLKYNPNEGTLALGNLQRQGIQRNALGAAMTGDDQAMNRALAVYDGKPMQVTHVADNVAFNPYAPVSSQAITPTAIGQTMMQKNDAGTAAQMALAAKHGATFNGVLSDGTGTYGRVQTPTGSAIVDFDSSLPQAARDAMTQAVTTGNPLSDAMSSTSAPQGTPGRWSIETNPVAQLSLARPSFDDVHSDMTATQQSPLSMLERINASMFGNGSQAAPASIDPADQLSGADAAAVADKGAYDKLPPGTLWRDPAGNLRRKR